MEWGAILFLYLLLATNDGFTDSETGKPIVLFPYGINVDSGGSSGVAYRGTSIDDDDWDYLPGNNQYRCRSRSSGAFLADYLCSDDDVGDSWY